MWVVPRHHQARNKDRRAVLVSLDGLVKECLLPLIEG